MAAPMAGMAVGGHVHTDMASKTVSLLRPILLLLSVVFALLACSWLPSAQAMMRPDRVAELRRATVDMFYHGFDNYMNIAFPEDEVCPLWVVLRSVDDLID